MLISLSSMFLKDYSIIDTLNKAKAIGYDGVEIWADHYYLYNEDVNLIKNSAKKLNLGITLHAPSYDINPLSSNKGIQKESKKQIFEAIELTKKIGASLIVIHPGHFSSTQDEKEIYFNRLIEFANECEKKANSEIIVTFELMEKRPKEFFQTPEDAKKLIENTKNIFLTVDIAHLHTLGNESELLVKIDKEWIKHIHISDSGYGITHLPLGEGEVDFDKVLSILDDCNFNVFLTIEGAIKGRKEELFVKNIQFLKSKFKERK